MGKLFRITGIVSAIMLIYIAIHLYIGWHIRLFLVHATGHDPDIWFWPLFGFIAFSFIFARLGRSVFPMFVSAALKVIGSLWMAPMQYLLLMLPAVDVAALILLYTGVEPKLFVLAASVATGLVLGLILLRGAYNAWSPVVRRYQIEIDKPAAKKNWNIIMASDLHLGVLVGKRHLQKLVDRVNEMKPDLILLAGDIIEEETGPFLRRGLDHVMKSLSAPFGVYAVLGNHEYYGGEVGQIVNQLRACNIQVLLDEQAEVADSFMLIGRKDRTEEDRKTLAQLLADVDMSRPVIIMDHQPTDLKQAAAAGADLTLSGHTHRGQLLPNHWITRRVFPLDWGYKKFGSMHAVVSSGYGTWGPPFRLGSRSELIELDVRFTG